MQVLKTISIEQTLPNRSIYCLELFEKLENLIDGFS